MGWFQHGILCTWQLFLAGCKQPWLALAGPFLTLLVQETASPDRQFQSGEAFVAWKALTIESLLMSGCG